MPAIVNANQINVAALTADDLYIQILQPPGYLQGVPTDVFAVVGTASYGPVNMATHLGSPQDMLYNFGGINAASLTDPHDGPTDIAIAFGQTSSNATIEGWFTRVTDGTDTKAGTTLPGTASAAGETGTVGGTIQAGDTVALTATSSAITGSPVTVTHTVAVSDTTATIAAALAALVNANEALVAAGIFASVAASVVSLYAIASLSPGVVWSKTIGGSSPTETLTLASASAASAGITLTAKWSGSLPNSGQTTPGFVATIAAGASAASSTVYLVGPNGLSEVYPNLPNANFWTNLLNAINSGVSGFRGPSLMVNASNANIAVGAPTLGNYSFSGGADGRSGVNTASLIGVDGTTSATGTGMYSLRQLTPAVSIMWLAGCTDATAWPTVLAFIQSEGICGLAPFATGTTSAAALAAVQSTGIHDPSFTYLKDWIYFFDPINNVVRLVSPAPFFGGTMASFQPQISPSNKPVALVIGTERYNAYTGNQPYTDSEVGQLASAGINVITNPIPAGSYFGIRMGRSSSLNPTTQPFEWWRMTIYLARSFKALGDVVGQNQSQQPQDPLRSNLKTRLNAFLLFLKSPAAGAGDGLGQIDDFTVVCTFSATGSPGMGVNTPTSISQHYLFALVRVRYLASVWYFVLALQGGTTVVTSGASPGADLVSLPQAA